MLEDVAVAWRSCDSADLWSLSDRSCLSSSCPPTLSHAHIRSYPPKGRCRRGLEGLPHCILHIEASCASCVRRQPWICSSFRPCPARGCKHLDEVPLWRCSPSIPSSLLATAALGPGLLQRMPRMRTEICKQNRRLPVDAREGIRGAGTLDGRGQRGGLGRGRRKPALDSVSGGAGRSLEFIFCALQLLDNCVLCDSQRETGVGGVALEALGASHDQRDEADT